MLDWCRSAIARLLIRYLSAPIRTYELHSTSDPNSLRSVLKPADILLVEGKQRFSTAIKYLTQSTWSHAAIFVGGTPLKMSARPSGADLIEADLQNGVTAAPLEKYANFNTRICRPVGLSREDCIRVVDYVVQSLGKPYDLKHVIDLARYLIPTPPVPTRWRRRMLALGSGDPTRVICSSLIAQAFQSIRYPILPSLTAASPGRTGNARESMHVRHHSLFTPRDFDLSPYFSVIKPTIERGFDHRELTWD